MQITIATAEDAKAIRQVQHDAWIQTYPNEEFGITLQAIEQRASEYLTEESIQNLSELLTAENQRTWVAKDSERIVGYCTVVKSDAGNAIRAIYVLYEYHGTGISGKLIEQGLQWLGSAVDVSAEVATYNHRAIRFYAKYGFKKNGETGFSGDIPTIFLSKLAASV